MQYQPIPGVMVVGFGHKARNGKDTAAGVFQDYFGKAARIFGFADDLYAICRVQYGMKDKNGKLLQDVGEAYRQRDPDIWVDCLYHKLNDKRPRVALITDVRHPNEAAMVKAMGGRLIQCIRRNADLTQYIATDRPADHISEIALDGYKGWDWTIDSPDVTHAGWIAESLARFIGEEIGIQHKLGPYSCL